MHAVIRADASITIGSGHIVRCMALAQVLVDLGWQCSFVCIPGTFYNKDIFSMSNVDIYEISGELPIIEEIHNFCPDGVDLLVIDHYLLGFSFESSLRNWAKQILVVDDLANRTHDTDFLLDQTYGRTRQEYVGLIPENCWTLLGSDYVLLRPEFMKKRAQSLSRRKKINKISRLLVSVGSTDPIDYTSVVLDAISLSGIYPIVIDVLLTSVAENISKVRAFATKSSLNINVYADINADSLATLLTEADLAIGAGGSAVWERCCVGLPTLAICVAENQQNVLRSLAKQGAILLLGNADKVDAKKIAGELRALSRNYNQLLSMSAHSALICDGSGASIVGKVLSDYAQKQ